MYFFEKEFKKDEKIVYGLTRVFGIGLPKAERICASMGISKKAVFKEIDNEIAREIMHKSLNYGKVMVDLKGEIYKNIQKNIAIRNYKGIRYSNSLPLRGQRTKTNARTAKKLLGKFK